MGSNPAEVRKSPAVACYGECPYFEPVDGTCTHENSQILMNHFLDKPEGTCPVYADWRAARMTALAAQLDHDPPGPDR